VKNKYAIIIFVLLFVDVIVALWILLHGSNIALLNPKGTIALQERNLIVFAVVLGLSVVLPVIAVTFFIAWKYRAGNSKAKYSPDRHHSALFESTWWAIPAVTVLILGVVTWKSTHVLDPYKPLETSVKPITIQVVSLRWKWLFIYPQQHIATVNFMQFPARTPVNFELMSDASMNSFWIPQLGSQIYTMAGMQTQLHLMADVPGDFNGSAAEISGQGFSGMNFIARASSQADFDAWVQSVKESPHRLDLAEYNKLAEPSEDNPVTLYASVENNLYNIIIMKYMAPISPTSSQMQMDSGHSSDMMKGMDMKNPNF
jgi:cytochrome o ubiquinol oxidase subunit II